MNKIENGITLNVSYHHKDEENYLESYIKSLTDYISLGKDEKSFFHTSIRASLPRIDDEIIEGLNTFAKNEPPCFINEERVNTIIDHLTRYIASRRVVDKGTDLETVIRLAEASRPISPKIGTILCQFTISETGGQDPYPAISKKVNNFNDLAEYCISTMDNKLPDDIKTLKGDAARIFVRDYVQLYELAFVNFSSNVRVRNVPMLQITEIIKKVSLLFLEYNRHVKHEYITPEIEVTSENEKFIEIIVKNVVKTLANFNEAAGSRIAASLAASLTTSVIHVKRIVRVANLKHKESSIDSKGLTEMVIELMEYIVDNSPEMVSKNFIKDCIINNILFLIEDKEEDEDELDKQARNRYDYEKLLKNKKFKVILFELNLNGDLFTD